MTQYRLVAYIRVDADEDAWLMDTDEDALAEQEQQALLFPGNLYCIEEVTDDDHREGSRGDARLARRV